MVTESTVGETDEQKKRREKIARRKSKAKKIWNTVWPPFALLLIALIFHAPIEDFITRFLVEPIFSKVDFKQNIIFSWAFNILTLSGLAYWIYRYTTGYWPSLSRTFWVLTVLGFYGFLRIGNPIWGFTKLADFGDCYLAHADVLFLLLLTFPTVKRESKKPAPEGIGFSTDSPIEIKEDNDPQQRRRYAETVYNLLGNTDLSERAFAVGISGVWGSGKTSFIKTLEKKMDATFFSLHFSPWRLDASQSITEAFFGEFANLLSNTTDTSVKDLVAYGRAITAEHSSNPIVDFGRRLFSSIDWDKSNIEELRSRIDDSLKNLEQKFAIYIDDLDRLDDDEVVEVLRLIRNAADFPNVVFIVAYDKAQIISALESKFKHGKEKYLEKIFQHEFHFAPLNQKEVFAELKFRVANLLTEYDTKAFEAMFSIEPFVPNYSYLKKYFNNYRDVIRYENIFKLHYDYVKGRIFIPDFFRIIILRCKYPTIASMLYDQRESLLTDFEDVVIKSVDKPNSVKLTINGLDDKLNFKKRLENNTKELGINPSSIDDIVDLVTDIFLPDEESKRLGIKDIDNELMTIRNSDYFERYFNEDTIGGLSNVDFQTAFSQSKDHFLSWVKEVLTIETSGKDLVKMLERRESFNDISDFDKVLSALSLIYSFPVPGKNDKTYSWFIDEKNFLDRILFESEHYPTKTSKLFGGFEKFREYILKFLSENVESENLPFKVLKKFAKTNRESVSIISAKEAIDMLKKVFLNEIEKPQPETIYIIRLYNFLKSLLSDEERKASELKFKEFVLTKDLDSFIKWAVASPPFEENSYFVTEWALEIFGNSLDTLSEEIGKSEAESKYKDEFLVFCEAFKDGGFQPIPFDFKTIPVGKPDN